MKKLNKIKLPKREIKFRAWDKKKKKMLPSITIEELASNVSYYWGDWDGCNIKNLTFLQYTGLKDRNGRRIYEGDVIKIKYHGISKVFLKNGSYKINGRLSVVGFGSQAKKSEVIGNIFENPDLINKL